MTQHSIRLAEPGYCLELAKFFAELGHPIDADSIWLGWQDWADAGNQAFVAQRSDGSIVGVVTLHQMRVLHRPKPVGRITLLFVEASARGSGIGQALVKAAEARLMELGCGMLEITSLFRWSEAHQFYERLGYRKTSVRLAKNLTISDDDP